MWQQTDTIDSRYWLYYHHLFGRHLTTTEVEGNFKKHLLLEMLATLGILQYVKDYEGCWEIVIKSRLYK